jgi:hypothetical protein
LRKSAVDAASEGRTAGSALQVLPWVGWCVKTTRN